jgi:hypothetical protein
MVNLDDSFFNSLKKSLVDSCELCSGTGFLSASTCSCMIEFRARHRLLLANFSPALLEIQKEFILNNMSFGSGKPYVEFFFNNAVKVKEKGLSLYIWGEQRGIGKTTLSHVLSKEFVKYFSSEENYARSNSYRFMEIGEFFDLAKHSDVSLYNEFIRSWDSTLFVLDDFGNEDRSARWSFDFVSKLIQDFLRHRTRMRLPTIITSNTSPVSISAEYKDDIASLLEVQPDGKIGGLLWREVFLQGRDLRLEKSVSVWKEAEQ